MGSTPREKDGRLPWCWERKRVCRAVASSPSGEAGGVRGRASCARASHHTRRGMCAQSLYPSGCVNDEVLAEVRAIGASTASAPGVYERDTFEARVAALLADPDDPDNRREFIRWAERTAQRGPTAEMRSAARLLLTLLRDGAAPAALHTVDPPLQFSVNPRWVLAVVAVVACLAAGGVMAARVVSTPSLKVTGPSNGTLVGPNRNGKIAFTAAGGAALLRRERWWLDGRDVTRFVQQRGARAVFRPGSLSEGGHEVAVTAGGGFLGASARTRLDFTIDLTPP